MEYRNEEPIRLDAQLSVILIFSTVSQYSILGQIVFFCKIKVSSLS